MLMRARSLVFRAVRSLLGSRTNLRETFEKKKLDCDLQTLLRYASAPRTSASEEVYLQGPLSLNLKTQIVLQPQRSATEMNVVRIRVLRGTS